jgi:thioredoxin 2
VQAIPTLIVLRGGEVIAQQTGAAPANVLREWLDRALASGDVAAKQAET